MVDLPRLQAAVNARLEAKHEAREAALRQARMATRCAANAIRATHRDERELAGALMADADAALRAAQAACANQPEVAYSGFIADAQKEYAEAQATFALVTGAPLPGPEDLGVPDAAYLNGLAEAVGELRRHLLDVLRAGRLRRSEQLLEAMDDIYQVLVTIDYPDGVTGGLRRSTDVARAIIERTRGDLTSALVQARLQDTLERHRRDLLR